MSVHLAHLIISVFFMDGDRYSVCTFSSSYNFCVFNGWRLANVEIPGNDREGSVTS